MASTEQGTDEGNTWFLQSSHPVLLPAHDALTASRDDFEAFVAKDLSQRHESASKDTIMADLEEAGFDDPSESFTEVSAPSAGTDTKIASAIADMDIDIPSTAGDKKPFVSTGNPFMDGLISYEADKPPPNMENKTFTENNDVAFGSSTNPLVDLFSDLEDNLATGPKLRDLLNQSWAEDPLMTVKIIFNARSIHLGKSSRNSFYQCAGWLAQNHPLTLIGNLRWISRPVIEKKVKKVEEGEEELVLVEEPVDENDPLRFDIKHGVSHGYWKDLLNMLALAANGKLDGLTSPKVILNTENPGISKGKSTSRAKRRSEKSDGPQPVAFQRRERRVKPKYDPSVILKVPGIPAQIPTSKSKESAHELRRLMRDARHRAVVKRLGQDPAYRCLHFAVARLFAEQLERDLAALRGSDPKAKRNISLCAKWAPSKDRFHEKHTFVISSIAEIMYPRESFDEVLSATDDRETYLRHAREKYRVDVSQLRKHLDVVERKLTENNYKEIKYDRLPSLAMKNYSRRFIENDLERFEKYLDDVAQGKSKISGATLLPSKMVSSAFSAGMVQELDAERKASMTADALIKRKMLMLEARVLDGQWDSLVQRIKDSGTLSSSIAVCDVSGSMSSPTHSDGTNPMESAIGLSLLVAEVTAPPFGSSFITFNDKPRVEKLDLSKTFTEKVWQVRHSPWGMNTNFTAVFERLILPIAVKNKVKPEDMVKRVFVFSDMQFDAANMGGDADWTTSFERIKGMYEKAGYELPELVFWNLGTHTTKPVTVTDEGTALVSGYSQGMLKVFLDGGGFEADEETDEVVVTKKEDGSVVTETVKAKTDPLKTVKKAVSHQAYDMLAVLD